MKKTVFIIDKEPKIGELFSNVLRRDGYETEHFRSPNEVLGQESSSDTPDIIIADIPLPSMSGVEFMETLGRQSTSVPVIFMMSRSTISEVVELMHHGAFWILQKPVNLEDLRNAMSKALRNESPQEMGAGSQTDYFSCFISHSSQDQEFVDRLHSNLKEEDVDCWFAPEDMSIGDRIREALENAIQLKEKVLLVLSDTSVQSQWVEHEVEAALEKERNQKRVVLFPIMIDRSVMNADVGWARLLRRTRNIGDFTGWRDEDKYNKSLERLLSDLKKS